MTESTSATFTFVADVPGSTYWCWFDGVLDENCSSPKSYTNVPPGEHLFAVLARGPNGAWEEQWMEYEWQSGDMTAPLTFIDSGPDIEQESGRAEFVFHSNEEGVTFTCSLDGADPVPCTSPYVIPRLAAGEHEMEILAVHPPVFDREGELIEPLYEDVPSFWNWTVVDHDPPDTAVLYGPPAVTTGVDAYFGFGASEGAARFECSVDWEDFGGCEPHEVFTDLLEGEHILHVRAVDLSENADQSWATHTWRIVRQAPNTPVGINVTVELPIPPEVGEPPRDATLNFFEVKIAGATTLDRLDGGPPVDLPGYGLVAGRYFDVNTTADFGDPLRLCLPYNPASFGATTPARLLEFDGGEWTDITVSNDSSAGQLCGEPKDLGLFAIAAGIHVPPLAMIRTGPDLLSETNTATFTFAADTPNAMLQCSIDGLPFTFCESPVTYKQLEVGDHKFEVRALGFSGEPLEQYVPAIYEWEVVLPLDTTPPDTVMVKGPPALTANQVVLVEFTGMDDQTIDLDLEFECLLDGVLLGSCSSVLSTPDVPGVPYEVEVEDGAYGKHTIEVRAIDEMGNVDPTPAKRVVDLRRPERARHRDRDRPRGGDRGHDRGASSSSARTRSPGSPSSTSSARSTRATSCPARRRTPSRA